MASEICSRSVRRSDNILLISIFQAYLENGGLSRIFFSRGLDFSLSWGFACAWSRCDPRAERTRELRAFGTILRCGVVEQRSAGAKRTSGLQKLTISAVKSAPYEGSNGSLELCPRGGLSIL